MAFEIYTLQNGIRVAHKRVDSPVAYCCIMVNTGTRDEQEEEHGIAHFIEHVIFKGTKKRKAFHIMSRLEDVGGELNAYTTKEETVIHATFLKDDFARAADLIADILFHSTFPEKELKKEKEVILDEINSYKDSPSELIFDDFEEMVYKNHPFGRNILGNKKCIKKFNRSDISSFMRREYNTDQMVFCSMGNIPFHRVKKIADKLFGWVSPNPRIKPRLPIGEYIPENKTLKKSTHQNHCIIGCTTFDLNHPKRIGMHLLNNILGGPGMNSRLNLSLRERNGFAYNVESNYSPYTDTGLFSIYFGSDKDNFNKSFDLVHLELDRMRNNKMGVLQLFKAKRQLIGQLAIASDNSEVLMLNAARSILVYNCIDSIDKINQQIESISASEILDIANEIVSKNRLSTLIYK
jgi:predicted Zn-dependent peptidase